MRKILSILILLRFASSLIAQTIVPGGLVSGTWPTSGSPYLVQGNLLIANGTSLIIAPGVTVNFHGSYKMLVSGRLVAKGTATDSVYFTAANAVTGWQGIRFDNTAASNDSSNVSYCSIKNGYNNAVNGGGIFIKNFSKISVLNCSIYNCTVTKGRYGSAIYAEFSDVEISNNKITYNHSYAGAIYVFAGKPVIQNNFISNNDNVFPQVFPEPISDADAYGGGLSIYQSAAIVNNNTITYNKGVNGGGVVAFAGNATFNNNIISNNSAELGGGMFCVGYIILSNNTISDNTATSSGGGLCFFDLHVSNPKISNNIILRNTATLKGGGIFLNFEYQFVPSSPASVTNNLIANNLQTSLNAGSGGGGISILNAGTDAVFSGNIIVNNEASNGGALFCDYSNPTLINNTISNNRSSKGGAFYCVNNSSPQILNTQIWGNTSSVEAPQFFLNDDNCDPLINYSNVQGGLASISTNGNFYTGSYENNIELNPKFVTPSSGSGMAFNGEGANWGLQNSSPAINTGKPNVVYPAADYAGKIRVVSGIIDMGAIENQTGIPPTAKVSGGGQACAGAIAPPVIFTFTNGTFPFTLQYAINGVPQTHVRVIDTLKYTIVNPTAGVYTVASINDTLSLGTGIDSAAVMIIESHANFTINNNSQCLAGNNFVFSNTSSVNNGAMFFTWSFGDGATSSAINPTHSYTTDGSYSVKLKVTSTAGCIDSIIHPVTLSAFNINPLQDTVTTFEDSFTLNAGAGFTLYNWSTKANSQSISVTKTGLYKVTVTNNSGCFASDSCYVNLRKNKTLFIDQKTGICSSPLFLSVRTKNISNVVGLQGTISWDTTLVNFNSIQYETSSLGISAADLNLSNTSKGYLTYLWNDNTLTGKSTPDSTKIFTIKFDKKKIVNEVTMPVTFSSAHTALEIDTINISTQRPVIATETAYINGSASFTASPGTTITALISCDSVVFKNKTYYTSTQVIDTVKFYQSQCDSVFKLVIITVYNEVFPEVSITSDSTTIRYGSPATFYSNTSLGGSSPAYQWYKNGLAIADATGSSYTSNTLNSNDSIRLQLQSSFTCAGVNPVYSNIIRMQVSYLLNGQLKNPAGNGVPNATIDFFGGSLPGEFAAGSDGNYNKYLTGGPGYNYILRPRKNNDVNRTNGVSTLDVALIQNHILNANVFTSPYEWIAADVTNNGFISSFDIINIKRFILGLDNAFAGNRLWVFVDSSVDNYNPLFPLQYKDSIVFNNLANNQINKNFIAVKLGDINFDWNSNVLRPAQPNTVPVTFYYQDVETNGNADIRIPIQVKSFRNILGMQFTINFNSTVLQFKAIENNKLNFQYATNHAVDGKIPFIWNDNSNKLASLNDDEVLMEMVFTPKAAFTEEDIAVSSDITQAEAWDGTYHKHVVIKGMGKIRQMQPPIYSFTEENWNVTPNPTKGLVQLHVQLLQDKNVNIRLADEAGRIVLSQTNHLQKGINNITINLARNSRLASGVYYITISSLEGSTVKRIVLVQ